MKIHVVALEKERLKLYQAISRTAIKLIPWELVHITFFGLSLDWDTYTNFSTIQMILIIILWVIIFIYAIFIIKMKGAKAFHDIISQTQIVYQNQT